MTYNSLDVFANEVLCEFLDNKFSPLLSRGSPITLLEVGCGSGALARILQDKYKDKVKEKKQTLTNNISHTIKRDLS